MSFKSRSELVLAMLALGLWLSPNRLAAAVSEPPVDFNFQVRPILADRCFACHGPDERARKAGLRLDQSPGEPLLIPGKPEQSELYRRIISTDPRVQMPPPESKLSLTAAEQDLLKKWIRSGAEYKPHWAFLRLREIAAPLPVEDLVSANPIDAFVASSLAQAGLVLSPEATREVLIRRLSFDLRGLPPSLEEVDSFLADKTSDAYEKLVDRFLASSTYGEHQARMWMDLARFADTYGYQSDVDRDISPWRDWLIQAFNDNLPYDQVILWQLAGDLLPNATQEQILATAFNRIHRQTNEGGSIDDEFRAEYVADRVETTGTAFLGLTMNCARCHDHKYDPITQKDFYRMAAFFNNIDESGMYSHFTAATPSPTLLLYRGDDRERHQNLRQRMLEAEGRLRTLVNDEAAFERWQRGSGPIPTPQAVACFRLDDVDGGRSVDTLNTNRWAVLVDGPVSVEGRNGGALRFSGDNSAVLKDTAEFSRTNAFTFSLWLRPTEAQTRAVVFHRSRAWADSGSRGYELLLEDSRPAFALIHFWPGNALKVKAKRSLPLGEWWHLAIAYDGSSRAGGVRIFVNGQLQEVEIVRDNLFKDTLHRDEWGDGEVDQVELTLAGRFRDSGFKNGSIDELTVFDRELSSAEVGMLFAPARIPGQPERRDYFEKSVHVDAVRARQELALLRAQENALVNDIPEISVMQEMAVRRPTYLLERGAYDAPREQVEPGTPEAVLPFPPDLPRNRLGLARWLTDARNPLPARVAVNRFWRSYFGRGLVESIGDFGVQGRLPTHPDLLDWLAMRFMQSGWDSKAVHRLIVTSATYRQTSIAAPELLARDPHNLLLGRGPKHRLEAEQIRDQALAVSGLLSPRIGGRSVRPYQPANLWEQSGTGKQYTQDQGAGLYRRSMYTFWRRTAPPPSMLIFDAPTREICIAHRETTTTPLQALVLMNDPQFVEASRVLAERLVRVHGREAEVAIIHGFRLVLGRLPTRVELARVRALYAAELQSYTAEPARAEQLLATGEAPPDHSLPPEVVAATTIVISTLMNLDEFITKR